MKYFLGGVFALCVYFLGMHTGVNGYFMVDHPIVIQSCKEYDKGRFKYKYKTNMFNFVSDSVYQVGDTIQVIKCTKR